jgi:hypothetical protein
MVTGTGGDGTMTTYQYTLSIGESEQLALEAALELMISTVRSK